MSSLQIPSPPSRPSERVQPPGRPASRRSSAPLAVLLVALGGVACETGSTTDPTSKSHVDRPHAVSVASFAFFLSCPDYAGWTFFGCKPMTGSERTGLQGVYSTVYPQMIYPSPWATYGDFREGGEDFLGMTLFVFDSLKVNGVNSIGFVNPLDGVGGVRLSDLGTTEAGRTVLHEGGHIRHPGMGEGAIEDMTHDCFDEFGQDY